MSRSNRPLLALAGVAILALGGCATVPGDAPTDGPADTVAVLGQGMVLQSDDETPQFCLGAVAESYPPQCSGPELTGWDWATVEGQDSANGVTWGSYAVWGDWDGQRLAVTDSVMLALYDPMPFEDPYLDPANEGATDESELLSVQETIHERAPVEVLMSMPQNGYLFVTVVYDDGAVQEWADLTYGKDVVLIRSALHDVA